MKTLIVTLEYPPAVGGIATYTFNVASNLAASDVVVYAPEQKNGEVFDADHPWKTYRHKPYWLLWPRWIRLYMQLRKIVKAEQITQLHVHHALPVGYAALLIKKFLNISYTVFLHGSDWQLAAQHRLKLKKLAWVLRGARRVVVNSEFSKSSLAARIPYLPEVVVVYPCPHDSFFTPNYTKEDVEQLRRQLALGGKKVLLTVSRMVDRKGHVRMAEAMVEIARREPHAVWLVVGDGPQMPAVVEIIQKNNLQGMVRLIPSQSPEALAKYYQLADVFVLLTHKDTDGVEEAWGTIFVEAAAAGLPVVAGDSGGASEAVQHLETGLVVDALNTQNVVNSIVSLLENPAYAKEMGVRGQKRARQYFQWRQQLPKFLA